jgi:AraC family transcriptional regulator
MAATDITLQKFRDIKVGNYKCHICAGTRSGIEFTPVYTLIFLLRGSFRHSTFRQSYFLTSEFVLFKKPGFEFQAIHEHYINDDCFYIEFGDKVIDEFSSMLSPFVLDFLKNKDKASLLLKTDPSHNFTSWRLHRGTNDSITSLEFQSSIVQLITAVLGQAPLSPSTDHALHDSIDKAKRFIAENYSDDISLEDIAKASHISPFHFSRVFKGNTNFTPHQFLLEVRLFNARKLLLDSTLNVTDVGYSSGFSNPDYFVTLFKKKNGLTPSEFRKSPLRPNQINQRPV